MGPNDGIRGVGDCRQTQLTSLAVRRKDVVHPKLDEPLVGRTPAHSHLLGHDLGLFPRLDPLDQQGSPSGRQSRILVHVYRVLFGVQEAGRENKHREPWNAVRSSPMPALKY